jgi:hypothetical protein
VVGILSPLSFGVGVGGEVKSGRNLSSFSWIIINKLKVYNNEM